MLRVAICDDDKYIGSLIENFIMEYMKSSYLKIEVDVFYKGEELILFLNGGHRYDLIFLDI